MCGLWGGEQGGALEMRPCREPQVTRNDSFSFLGKILTHSSADMKCSSMFVLEAVRDCSGTVSSPLSIESKRETHGELP